MKWIEWLILKIDPKGEDIVRHLREFRDALR